MRPILLEKKKWKPEIKDSWMTFFSSIVKVFKKNFDFPLHHYNALSRFSTKVWFFPMSLSHHSALTLTYDITFQPYQCSTEIQETKIKIVVTGDEEKWEAGTKPRRGRGRGGRPQISGLQLFLERKYKVFEIGFDAYNVLSLLHLMHPWLIHVPGYILLQFAFLCFIFCKPCQSFRGHVIIKYIILFTGLQKEHFR